ncbi:MAG TPA: hypothetical protein VE864_07610 [Streptosporangiaceae bacterium]|nr:hypothetical protein [Streptosporangiaceae bacterium]
MRKGTPGGRLTLDELNARLEVMVTAKAYGELAPVAGSCREWRGGQACERVGSTA